MPLRSVSVVLCDLDGVVWLAHRPIQGSVEAIARLREAGIRVVFVTNNSASTLAEHEAALAEIGIDAVGDVLSSSMAAATLVRSGERVSVCGGAGIREAARRAGAIVVDDSAPREPVDAVIVGLDRSFDYGTLHRTSSAIRDGARFIATNEDATFPTPDGPIPGGGAMVAAIATAAGRRPRIAGKPHEAMVSLARRHVGAEVPVDEVVVIGDRPSTDGRFAAALGARFALVATGVTEAPAEAEVHVDVRARDLASVVDVLLGSEPAANGRR